MHNRHLGAPGIMADMSESSEYTVASTPVSTVADPAVERPLERPVAASKPNRLYQAAAWVAIVAGTLFIASAVFWTGFMLGRDSGGPGGFHRGGMMGPGMMMEHDRPGMGPMYREGPGMGGPGMGGPGMGGPGMGGGPGAGNPGQPQPAPGAPTR